MQLIPVIKHNTENRYRGGVIAARTSKLCKKIKVRTKIHVPATLSTGKEPPAPIRCVRSQSRSGRGGE
jgi:hypothetical protein